MSANLSTQTEIDGIPVSVTRHANPVVTVIVGVAGAFQVEAEAAKPLHEVLNAAAKAAGAENGEALAVLRRNAQGDWEVSGQVYVRHEDGTSEPATLASQAIKPGETVIVEKLQTNG